MGGIPGINLSRRRIKLALWPTYSSTGTNAMMRVRLKADGRIVEIMPDGTERTVDHSDPASFVRQVRARCGLTQAAFAEKIEVPIETVRNWEQGKRSPRGPARALLKLIDTAPDAAFAALGGRRR